MYVCIEQCDSLQWRFIFHFKDKYNQFHRTNNGIWVTALEKN